MKACHYCGSTTEELRPYGPNNAPICFPCGTSDEHMKATAQVFNEFLDVAIRDALRGEGIIILGSEEGIKGE